MQDYVRLDKLQALPNNPKDHDIGQIVQSIERFGFAGSIIINQTTNHIVCGHGRVEALRWMKVKNYQCPTFTDLDDSDGMWKVPVDYVSVPESEETALAISLNRLVEQGGWDNSELLKQLDDLVVQGRQMLDGIGFDEDDIDQIRTRLKFDDRESIGADEQVEQIEAGEAEQQAIIDKAQQTYNVQEGDLWQVGKHYLLCGDARKADTWYRITHTQPHLNFADGIFTSPPYAKQREEYYESVEPSDYNKWYKSVQDNMLLFLNTDSSYFLNIKANVEDGERLLYVMDLVTAHKREWGWAYIDQFCWERPAPSGNWPNRFKNAWDSVYHFAPQPNIHFYPDNVAEPRPGESKGASNVNTGKYFNMHNGVQWTTSRPSNRLPTFGQVEGLGHPAAFPPALPAFFMVAYSKPGSVWIDPFVGSGSTVIAAADTNRIGLGMDVSPNYIALSLQRLEAFTGESAVLIDQKKDE